MFDGILTASTLQPDTSRTSTRHWTELGRDIHVEQSHIQLGTKYCRLMGLAYAAIHISKDTFKNRKRPEPLSLKPKPMLDGIP